MLYLVVYLCMYVCIYLLSTYQSSLYINHLHLSIHLSISNIDLLSSSSFSVIGINLSIISLCKSSLFHLSIYLPISIIAQSFNSPSISVISVCLSSIYLLFCKSQEHRDCVYSSARVPQHLARK